MACGPIIGLVVTGGSHRGLLGLKYGGGFRGAKGGRHGWNLEALEGTQRRDPPICYAEIPWAGACAWKVRVEIISFERSRRFRNDWRRIGLGPRQEAGGDP